MKISKVKLKNFRGYRNETTIEFNDFTAFVGKNDAGKSSVLEALDIFFNDGKGACKIEQGDINVEENRNGNTDIKITVCFVDLPDEIILDSTHRTNLRNEYLLNTEGELEIVKIFPNAGKAKVYLHANHPCREECKDLLLKKNNELKTILRDCGGICENQSVNALLRTAIWNVFADDLNLSETNIETAKEDAKTIWQGLVKIMPIYSLFKADRSNSDGDSEVQDPLKIAVEEVLKEPELQDQLEYIANSVTNRLQEVSNATLNQLNLLDPTVANTLSPQIPSVVDLKWGDVFKKVSISGDTGVPVNKRGSGVKRLILISFFKAEVERKRNQRDNVSIIYALEEPETSQHAANQKILMKAIMALAGMSNTQVIVTTHSGFCVKEMSNRDIRVIVDDQGIKRITLVSTGYIGSVSLNEINYDVFGEVTEEYHNELYGYIDLNGWLNEFRQGKQTFPYNQLNNNGTTIQRQLVKTEIIRHQIHHPENTSNVRYTAEELKTSIEDMREFIDTKRTNN